MKSRFAMLACVVAASVVLGSAASQAAAPADLAADLLRRFDDVMSPGSFESDVRMIAHREDGSTRSYVMHVLKSGDDKLRATFKEPASAKDQEMLRNGDNLWVYMPSVRRAQRVASRDNFMGGDFNNADVLRAHYASDYTAVLGKSDVPNTTLLELKAKGPQVAYDVVKLWMNTDKDPLPVRAEFYASSGKLLRSAAYLDVKDFGKGVRRPARIEMKNELTPARHSEMVWDAFTLKNDLPQQRFTLDDLGR